MTCERPWVLPAADACRWLLRLVSPLGSGAATSDGSYPSPEAHVKVYLLPRETGRDRPHRAGMARFAPLWSSLADSGGLKASGPGYSGTTAGMPTPPGFQSLPWRSWCSRLATDALDAGMSEDTCPVRWL